MNQAASHYSKVKVRLQPFEAFGAGLLTISNGGLRFPCSPCGAGRSTVSEDNHPKQEGDQRVLEMKKSPDFDQEEVEILRDFEHGGLTGIRNFEEEKRRMETAARDSLISSTLHKYVAGKLKPVE